MQSAALAKSLFLSLRTRNARSASSCLFARLGEARQAEGEAVAGALRCLNGLRLPLPET